VNTIQEPEELLASSKRRLQVSDHFLTQTYPQVQEPKLLLNILDGVMRALEEMLDALLITERRAGRIPAYNDHSLAGKLMALKAEAVRKRYGFSQLDLHMISEIQELLHLHKQSAMEFPRKGSLVMASDDFALRSIGVEKTKTYLTRAKTLYTRINDGLRHTAHP
jgi:hypothetical protein